MKKSKDIKSENPSTVAPIETPSGPPWRPWKGNSATRCVAYKKTGERCRRQARMGTTVCDWHGAKAPQVKRRARQRIEEASERLALALLGMATDETVSESVRLAAIRDALSRAGISERTSVDVEVEHSLKPFEAILEGIAPLTREESRALRGVPNPALAAQSYDQPEIIDAEIVDESAGTRADRRAERRNRSERSPVAPDAAEGRSARKSERRQMPEMSIEDALENTHRQARKAGVYGEPPRGRIKFRR